MFKLITFSQVKEKNVNRHLKQSNGKIPSL